MRELGRWSLGRGIFRSRRLGLGRDGGPRQWAGVSLRGLRRVLRLRSRACPRRSVSLPSALHLAAPMFPMVGRPRASQERVAVLT